ncbi:MAG: hypothetical protein CVU08_12645 [Bacteroidetes bacterium HGW-Bacteroidetes-3]|jgi:hypothetical protein|nr:MAG: hypothetical protein CVU08_12645 [Bacteroidetes bacterium HGW-Bacteroidetes-3]
MENIKDNIELRSDKVRSIIGQIPPLIIRSGISVILLVIIVLLIGSCYFKYPYTITTTVEFSQIGNSYIGIVKIPANEISKVKKGQEVEIYFENIKNLNGLMFKSTLDEISNKITITDKIGFYKANIYKMENLNISEQTSGIATIKTDEISFFDRIIKPFKMLKTD